MKSFVIRRKKKEKFDAWNAVDYSSMHGTDRRQKCVRFYLQHVVTKGLPCWSQIPLWQLFLHLPFDQALTKEKQACHIWNSLLHFLEEPVNHIRDKTIQLKQGHYKIFQSSFHVSNVWQRRSKNLWEFLSTKLME